MGLELRATDKVGKSDNTERQTNTFLVWGFMGYGYNQKYRIIAGLFFKVIFMS